MDKKTIEKQILQVQHANRVKQKIKKLLQQLDSSKLCVVTEDAFFSLLEMNGIQLNANEKHKLAKQSRTLSTNGPGQGKGSAQINFKDALNYLNVDHSKSGVTPESLKWTIRQVQKEISQLQKQEALNNMAQQMFVNESRNLDNIQDDAPGTQKLQRSKTPLLNVDFINQQSPEVKSSRLTKLNIEQIDNLNVDAQAYRTVETDRSILDRFNSAKKSQEGSVSSRSRSQMTTNRQMEQEEGINNFRSSYDEKLTNTVQRQTLHKVLDKPTPSRFQGSKTALSQYRQKHMTIGQSPQRIITDKNDVYDQLCGSARKNTIQPQKLNDGDAQSIISQAIASVRGTRGNSLMQNSALRVSNKLDTDYKEKAKPRTSLSPFKRNVKEQKVTYKNHKLIRDCYNTVSNDPNGILFGMGEEPLQLNEGKRIFTGVTNISDKTGMYPVIKEDKEVKDLFLRMSDKQYYDKSKVKYVAPPVVKDINRRHSFVHNVIQNKNKINLEHFYKIYNKKVLNKKKREIFTKMHEQNIDFRMLTAFKNALFDSEYVVENHLIPLHEWSRIKPIEMIYVLDDVEPLILEECLQENDMVNLQKFTDIVDLFIFLPKQKLPLSNDSTDVFYLMSGNTYGGPTSNDMYDQGGPLKRMLDLIWIKISDRFKGMAEAYRYFDVNFNNRVSFNEFQKGLDHMRLKFQVNELDVIFKLLDRGQKGYITYNDFCGLSEEKRRNLDRIDNHEALERQKLKEKSKKDWIQLYLEDAEFTDLENMSKRVYNKHKALSTEVTQEMSQMKNNLPQWLKNDPDFRFGMSTAQFAKDKQNISSVINNDYLKQYLSKSIAQKAMDQLANQKKGTKDWRNRVFNLRSQSVAQQIKKVEMEKALHTQKMKLQRPQKQTTVAQVHKRNKTIVQNNNGNMDFLNQPLTMSTLQANKMMHSTHGPFFQNQNKLPPLSALNKYERSTIESDYDQSMVPGTKRAQTNMEMRGPNINERSIVVDKPSKNPNDPFYSQEMINLADEGQKLLDNLNSNKIDLSQPADETIIDRPKSQFERMAFKTAGPQGFSKGDVLENIHKMRLTSFENRINDPMNVKPYLPMLSSDEKEVIMEQYYASKKKLSKGIKKN